jgi:hypothetical protein
MIGGVVYTNVAAPIAISGGALLGVHRNRNTGALRPSINIITAEGVHLASMRYGVITSHLPGDFVVTPFSLGQALRDSRSGRVWCEFQPTSIHTGCEFELSCLTHHNGIPIILHPDRSVFGESNRPEVPQVRSLSLVGNGPTAWGAAINLGSTGRGLVAVPSVRLCMVGVRLMDWEVGVYIDLSSGGDDA